MQLKPLGNNLIVACAPEENKTASGILLPDSSTKEQQDRGTVIAVGAGKVLENGTRQVIDVKVGDNIVFKKWGKEEIELEEAGEAGSESRKKKYLIVSADEVMAIIE